MGRFAASLGQFRDRCFHVATEFDPIPAKFSDDGYHPSADSYRVRGEDLARWFVDNTAAERVESQHDRARPQSMIVAGKTWLLIPQAAATLVMPGLIWFVQIVDCRLFGRVGVEAFARQEGAHTRRTSWVVGPPMLIEAANLLTMVFRPPTGVSVGQAWPDSTRICPGHSGVRFRELPHSAQRLRFQIAKVSAAAYETHSR